MPVPVDELFESVIDSSAVGVRKPDPAIFQLALQAFGDLLPANALFLDDYPANIEVAQSLGMQTILVSEDPHKTVRDISVILPG